MRFHLLGLAHTISTPDYSACAFTQKIVKLAAMLTRNGHQVTHYGNAGSRIEAEHITIGKAPRHDWRKLGFPPFDIASPLYQNFNARAVKAIKAAAEPGDFLLCMFGAGHRPIADELAGLIPVEPGIGYAGGYFAPFKVFESYALLHAYRGLAAVAHMSNDHWYDVVIPNYFDPDEFEYRDQKGDYLLFLGRIGPGKGTHIAQQIAAHTGQRLVVTGPGAEFPVAGPEERRELLAGARAVICASTYLEPFCGVQIEAMLSGTPVISSDFGAFAEYNVHGVTGYRCRTFEQFKWAAQHVDLIDPAACRAHGLRFTMGAIYPLYDDYFRACREVMFGEGWYAERDRSAVWPLAPH